MGNSRGLEVASSLTASRPDPIVTRYVTGYRALMPGPRPRNGIQAMTPAERTAAYRERQKAAKPMVVRYRRPDDRRSRPKRWQYAVDTLTDLLDDYQAWRDSLPANLADSAIADQLDELLALRDLVDQLAAADLPKGFGRD